MKVDNKVAIVKSIKGNMKLLYIPVMWNFILLFFSD